MFVDRLHATVVLLCHGAAHDVPASWFGVDRSIITWAISEMRPLQVERGRSVSPRARLQTLAQVMNYLGTTGKTGIIGGGTEIRVLRLAARRKGYEAIHERQRKAHSSRLPGQAGLDDAVGAGRGQVMCAAGCRAGEPQWCASGRAMTCTFIPCFLCFCE